MAATLALRAGSEIRSCSSTSSGSGAAGGPDSPRPRSPRPVAEDEHVRRRAVDQPERDARVRGMRDRSLPLDEQQLAPALVPLDDEPLGGARRGNRRRPRRRRSPSPRSRSLSGRSGRSATAIPRARAARSSSSETVIFPIAQSEPTVSTILRRHARGWRRWGRSGRRAAGAGRAARRRGAPRARLSSASSREELVQPVLDVAGPSRCSSSGARATPAGSGRPAVATPTSAVVGPKQSASFTVADDRDAVLRLPRPRRVEDRDDVSSP